MLTTSQISHEAVHSSPRPFYTTESADFNTTHVGKQHRTHPTITPLSASARNAQNPAVLTQSARPILPCPAAASQRAPHRIGNQAEGHSCTHLRQSPPSPFLIAIYTSSHRLNQAQLHCATHQASRLVTFGPLRSKQRHPMRNEKTPLICASHQKPIASTRHLMPLAWRSSRPMSATLTMPSSAPSSPRSEHLKR